MAGMERGGQVFAVGECDLPNAGSSRRGAPGRQTALTIKAPSYLGRLTKHGNLLVSNPYVFVYPRLRSCFHQTAGRHFDKSFELADVAVGSVEEEPTANMNNRYLVREVETKQELDEVLDVIWAANHTPYEPFIQLFFPVLGFTRAHREAALIESKERFWTQHTSDPSSHWLYAFDTITGKTVGCSQWVISMINPFAKGVPKLEAPWWPEGECREFCESILNQVYKPRANWMTRPHCALNWMAVHPAHRLCGIGSLLMDAGIRKADNLELECWLEGSSMGKPLYEKFSFQSLLKIAFNTELSDASDEWRKCAHEMTPAAVFAMWRPKRGLWKLDNGQETGMPWTLDNQPVLNDAFYESRSVTLSSRGVDVGFGDYDRTRQSMCNLG